MPHIETNAAFQQFKAGALRAGAKSMGGTTADRDSASGTPQLADVLSVTLKNETKGFHKEETYDVAKCLERKAAQMETKANEVMHTSNTGYGAELVPGTILLTDFLDFTPKANPLLQEFRGFHGRDMDLSAKVPAIGELDFHQLMPEQTTGAFAVAQGKGRLPTDKVTIDQKQYFFSVDISEWELRFPVVDLLAIIKQKLAASAARTITASIINGDTETGANANINSIDGTPTSTDYYLGGSGLVNSAFDQSLTADLGTLDFTDFMTLQNLLGENAVPEEIVYIMGTAVKNKALTISEFLASYQNGLISTAITGKLPEFLGTSYSVQRDLAKANTAGKVATGTPANNTKGRMLCVHRMAPQWGFNGEYAIEIYRMPGKGLQVVGYYFMGYAIATNLAGQAGTVALGYNITV